jgi:hypothetical protein
MGGVSMSTTTGGTLNLVKPELTDDHKVTIGTDLPANFQKIDDTVSAHLAENATLATVHGLRYEEGSWTPILYGSTTAGSHTYTVQSGEYIRINKKVTCYGNIQLSAKDAAMAGSVKLGGLPFTVAGTMGSISFGYIANLDYGTGELSLHGYPVLNTTRLDLIMAKDNTSPAALQAAAISNTTEILFTIEYVAA